MHFFENLHSMLIKNQESAVATMVNGIGSLPRENGAQMMIAKSGAIEDTIGGGKLGADIIALAKQVILSKTNSIHHFEMKGEQAALSEMICGGKPALFTVFKNKCNFLISLPININPLMNKKRGRKENCNRASHTVPVKFYMR